MPTNECPQCHSESLTYGTCSNSGKPENIGRSFVSCDNKPHCKYFRWQTGFKNQNQPQAQVQYQPKPQNQFQAQPQNQFQSIPQPNFGFSEEYEPKKKKAKTGFSNMACLVLLEDMDKQLKHMNRRLDELLALKKKQNPKVHLPEQLQEEEEEEEEH